MKITTLNCQGLARKSKCPDVLDFYMKKYYIVTHFTENVKHM